LFIAHVFHTFLFSELQNYKKRIVSDRGNPFLFGMQLETIDETHVPAPYTQAQKHSRLSGTNVDKKREKSSFPPPGKRPPQANRERREVILT